MQLQMTWSTSMRQGLGWLVREGGPAYAAGNDILLSELKAEAAMLARRVSKLSDLSRAVTPMEEAKMVFQLEAILDMRRELISEAHIR